MSPANENRAFRTGDLVCHGVEDVPSRRIIVGFVEGQWLYSVFGADTRRLPLHECWLLKSVNDEDHRALLLELSERDTPIGQHARRALQRMVERVTR